jgi:hypothetical protein
VDSRAPTARRETEIVKGGRDTPPGGRGSARKKPAIARQTQGQYLSNFNLASKGSALITQERCLCDLSGFGINWGGIAAISSAEPLSDLDHCGGSRATRPSSLKYRNQKFVVNLSKIREGCSKLINDQ